MMTENYQKQTKRKDIKELKDNENIRDRIKYANDNAQNSIIAISVQINAYDKVRTGHIR